MNEARQQEIYWYDIQIHQEIHIRIGAAAAILAAWPLALVVCVFN
jgi:hypothetical protein